MRIVVGFTNDSRGDDALAFAVLWASAARSSLVVTHVMQRPWPAHDDTVADPEWMAYLRSEAVTTLDRARALVPRDIEADYVIGEQGGTGRGLADVGAEQDGRLVVIGSATDGRPGTIRIGSTANQLLHGAASPVTVVPEGYAHRGVARAGPDQRGLRTHRRCRRLSGRDPPGGRAHAPADPAADARPAPAPAPPGRRPGPRRRPCRCTALARAGQRQRP